MASNNKLRYNPCKKVWRTIYSCKENPYVIFGDPTKFGKTKAEKITV